MLYLAKAIGPTGAITHLEIDADSASDAATRIVGQGFRVLSLVPSKSLSLKQVSWQGKFSLLTFSQELLSLLDAGLGLIEALNALARKERREADRVNK